MLPEWEATQTPHQLAYRAWIRSQLEWFKRAFTQNGTSNAPFPLETEADHIPTSGAPSMARPSLESIQATEAHPESVSRGRLPDALGCSGASRVTHSATRDRSRAAPVLAGSVETRVNRGECSSQRGGLL